jgi:Bifunctional DNA primase/polymerase, N-terminal
MTSHENSPTVRRAAVDTHADGSKNPALLIAEALAISELHANVLDATDIGTHAIEYALHGWAVLPLRKKIPAIASPHPGGSRGAEHKACGGKCGRPGHGLLDATTNIAVIAAWWSDTYVGFNIGGRIPAAMAMIDIDPYHGGLESLAALERKYGPLPTTLTDMSGRGDGGRHLFFRRPAGKLTDKCLGGGIDLKTSTGYAVLPPSIHPDPGRPYTRIEAPVATPPGWLIELLQVPRGQPVPSSISRSFSGPSLADQFGAKPRGCRSSAHTVGRASTPIPMWTGPAGCILRTLRRVRPRSVTAAFLSSRLTPRSRPLGRETPTATTGFGRMPS